MQYLHRKMIELCWRDEQRRSFPNIPIRVWRFEDFCNGEERKVWARNFKRDRSRGAWHVPSPNVDTFFYPSLGIYFY